MKGKTVANLFRFASTLGFSPFSGPARACLVLTRALSALTFAVSDNFGQTPPHAATRSMRLAALSRFIASALKVNSASTFSPVM